MILDTSAIVAVLFREPHWSALVDAMERADAIGCGAPTLVEAGIVLGARRGFDLPHLHRFVQEFDIAAIPFGEEHWSEAVRAYDAFGKGRHRAALNFGDCLAYAAASLAQRPLLCIESDFPHTDLALVDY